MTALRSVRYTSLKLLEKERDKFFWLAFLNSIERLLLWKILMFVVLAFAGVKSIEHLERAGWLVTGSGTALGSFLFAFSITIFLFDRIFEQGWVSAVLRRRISRDIDANYSETKRLELPFVQANLFPLDPFGFYNAMLKTLEDESVDPQGRVELAQSAGALRAFIDYDPQNFFHMSIVLHEVSEARRRDIEGHFDI